jgi:hypothetical protein
LADFKFAPERTSKRTTSMVFPNPRVSAWERIALTLSPEVDERREAARVCARRPARRFNTDAIDIEFLHGGKRHLSHKAGTDLIAVYVNSLDIELSQDQRSLNQPDFGLDLDISRRRLDP